MTFRVAGLILFLGLIVAFIGFNLGNACNISFGFTILSGVPVYMTILTSLVAGMLLMLPFTFRRRRHPLSGPSQDKTPQTKEKKGRKPSLSKEEAESGDYGID